MVPGNLVALAAPLGRPLHDVHARTVVALHVEIAGREGRRLSIVQVSRDGERLQKHLGHDDRAAQIEDYASIVESGERRREPPEIAVAGVADCGAVRGGVLVYDLGTEGRVDCARNSEPLRG